MKRAYIQFIFSVFHVLLFLVIGGGSLFFFCQPSDAAPPKVPGNQPTSHARHPPGTRQPPRTYAPPAQRPSHGGHHAPPPHHPHHGYYPPPPPYPYSYPYPGYYPPPIPAYLYPPTVIQVPVVVPSVAPPVRDSWAERNYGTDSGYGSEQDSAADTDTKDALELGIFKAFVYKESGSEEVQQTGVARIWMSRQNLIFGYFYTSADTQPSRIQGSVIPGTGEASFRVVGTGGTYLTTLNALSSREKVDLTLERTDEETGALETLAVGYLTRVEGADE